MVTNKDGELSSWFSTHKFSANVRVSRGSPPLTADKGLLANKSAKVASLLEENPFEDLSTFFKQLGADAKTLELVARFCHGFEITMTSDNIIPLICIAHHLKMTETHSPNNLLNKSITFFQKKILPSWDLNIQSLRASPGPILQQASDIGLLGYCLDALVGLALSDPTLLAQPITIDHRNNKDPVRRKLFVFGTDNQHTSSEDLTSLPLRVYELIIETMTRHRVPPENIVGSLSKYFKTHTSSPHDDISHQRQVIQVIEHLLPDYPSLIPMSLLFEMYTMAVSSGAGPECLNGLENRIGRQLDRITVKDLLTLDPDTDSLRRILKGYYGNFTEQSDSGLVAVAELMESYLTEMAKRTELDSRIFLELADMATSTMCIGEDLCLDGIYRAVVIYLEKHASLSENEKEEICKVLDFNRMSAQACNHATLNRSLPLRAVVQALFIAQLQLRDDMIRVAGQNGNFSIVEGGGGGGEEEEGRKSKGEDEEEWGEERREMMVGHERSCCEKKGKGKKASLWKEVKRKLGCMGSNSYETLHRCNYCQVKKRKKVHPK